MADDLHFDKSKFAISQQQFDRSAQNFARGICSYIELLRSKLLKTGDPLVGNWHVNCQHSSYHYYSSSSSSVSSSSSSSSSIAVVTVDFI